MTRKLLLSCTLALLLALPAVAADISDRTLTLALKDGLVYQPRGSSKDPTPKPIRIDVDLEVTNRNGKWDPEVWAWCEQQPGQEHLGKLLEARETADGWQFKVRLEINHNRTKPMVLGGFANYVIDVKRDGDKLTGSFSGACEDVNTPEMHYALEKVWGMGYSPGGKPWNHRLVSNTMSAHLASADVKGGVEGRVGPITLPKPKQGIAIQPGEHPRLFFRNADMDEIRRRMKTPLGEKIVEQLEYMLENPGEKNPHGPIWGTGWAMMYQLTGEKKYADRAFNHMTGWMFNAYYYGGWYLHSYTMTGGAVIYDLCYDGWSQQQRDLMYVYLERNIRDLAMRHDGRDLTGGQDRYTFANDQGDFVLPSVDHHDKIKFRAGAALAALALLNDPVPGYAPPTLDDVQTIEPEEVDPWIGVPVVPFESDKMARRWLVAGPFKRGTQDEMMKQSGGFADAQPVPGDEVIVDGVTTEWRQYLPSNHASKGGASIYSRNCARYWTSATGGGYIPGIELREKWKEDSQERRPAINVAIYTIIDNDAERIVQALPNWRSASIGNRMWINGVELDDGELARLKPGKYRLMIDVAVRGGYSGQAPKLREYTAQDHRRNTEAIQIARDAFSGDNAFDNAMQRNLTTLTRSIQRYIDHVVGEDGWHNWHAHHSLLPFLTAYKHVFDINLAEGAGLQELMPIALRMHGHLDTRDADFMVSQSVALMKPEDQPIARWYFENKNEGLSRPLDAVIALATHPFDVEPKAPGTRYALSGGHEGYGVYQFASGWQGSDDMFVRLHAGSGKSHPMSSGHVVIHGKGQPWAANAHITRSFEDHFALSNLTIRNIFRTGSPQILHQQFEPDGSGVVSFKTSDLKKGRVWTDEQGKTGFELSADLNPKITMLRSVGVDYSGKAGVPALIVTADKVWGSGKREKIWRTRMSRVEHISDPRDKRTHGCRINEANQQWTVDVKESPFTMRTTMVGPELLRISPVTDERGHFAALNVRLHPHLDDIAKEETNRLDNLADEVLAEFNIDLEKRGAGDRAISSAEKPDDFKLEDSVLKDILRDMVDDEKKEREAREQKLPPVTILSVTTVQNGAPPEVIVEGEGENRVIKVGNQTIRFDGEKIIFGR